MTRMDRGVRERRLKRPRYTQTRATVGPSHGDTVVTVGTHTQGKRDDVIVVRPGGLFEVGLVST